jgi:hypothetical protein
MTAFATMTEADQAKHVLTLLQRALDRNNVVYARMRKKERKPATGLPLLVCIVTPEDPVPSADHINSLPAWSIDFSGGGAGFIMPQKLDVQVIHVGIPLANGRHRWMQSKTVRCREIPGEGFWEYGVVFETAIVPA